MPTIENKDENSLLQDPLLQRLFRLFLLFAEPNPGQSCSSQPPGEPPRLTPSQTHFLVNELFKLTRPRRPNIVQLPVLAETEPTSFRNLIEICDLLFPDRMVMGPIIDRVFDRYVSQIVHKGFLMCRKTTRRKGCIQTMKLGGWKSYWCTVIPGTIYLWPLHKAPTVANRKTITFENAIEVEMGSFSDDRFTWSLKAGKAIYEFGHFDEIQRNFWMRDMQLVSEHRSKSDLLNFDRSESHRAENLGTAEKNLSWRLALEADNLRLTELLNEERQALYDEEIVRTLATRMLEEEREKSERLEKTVSELETQLAAERLVRANIEQRLREQTAETLASIESAARAGKLTKDQLDFLIISTQSV
ncbi:hypothetical protein QR680_011820 [Steinernema hermaphroditum]|uniref:PH domain-containing protein n=1 Tax=Steinernema hermaphroditum TaxID=289476 RepID=A0AA39HZU8_9BILA|nr:hypothetical protein QR680_011820 [Steinernema hermaphroditum]